MKISENPEGRLMLHTWINIILKLLVIWNDILFISKDLLNPVLIFFHVHDEYGIQTQSLFNYWFSLTEPTFAITLPFEMFEKAFNWICSS